MPTDLDKLGGHEFEDLVEQLLAKMGFKTEGRKPSADGGTDIVAVSYEPLVQGRYIIQCKRYSHPVSAPIIRDLYGVINATDANKGVLITTSRFTTDAVEFARDKPIELIDGPRLQELLQKYSLLTGLTEQKVSPTLTAIGFLRNEVVGRPSKFGSQLEEIETDVNLLGSRNFGSDRERRTYNSYRDFSLEVLDKLKRSSRGSTDVLGRVQAFLHSPTPEPEAAKRLVQQLEEVIQHLLSLHREMNQSIPPALFSQAHEILRVTVRTSVTDLLDFLKQLEEVLQAPQGKIELRFNARLTRLDEWRSAWDEAMKKAKSKIR